jgi:hypothetical protein
MKAALQKIEEGNENDSEDAQYNQEEENESKTNQKLTALERKQTLNDGKIYSINELLLDRKIYPQVPLDDLDDFFGKKEKKVKNKKKEKNVGAKHFEKI